MPFRAFCSFLRVGVVRKVSRDMCLNALPGILFFSTMPWQEQPATERQIECLNALPGILFFSTAGRGGRDRFSPVVSMPFRAFCSFLQPARGDAPGASKKGLNALPGILFFSTDLAETYDVFPLKSLNALPGILFFSTVWMTLFKRTSAMTSLNALPGILFFSTSTSTAAEPAKRTRSGLNALPGILFFSTNAKPTTAGRSARCLNALPGILFFSTEWTQAGTHRRGTGLNALPGILFFSTFRPVALWPSLRMVCLNALPGILFFSTLLSCRIQRQKRLCLNALPGILFFSTDREAKETAERAVRASQCPSGHFVLFYFFLEKSRSRVSRKELVVSMPFRAFCSFLRTS